eukprot:TRINITY_DN37212_c0_g1_i1.p1 TRINITY_DN37212_c0_g1~~TRINITY_DN37212_c0_g1_i1.p1  ORF type:complete len:150 (-),score=17.91 TRINITY_DN37212_c0_g1_i1:57-506(-)
MGAEAWKELAAKPATLITEEIKETPGIIEIFGFHSSTDTVSATVRVELTGIQRLLQMSGRDGRFTWIRDRNLAPEDTTIWLARGTTIQEALGHAENLETLGLVEKRDGIGIRIGKNTDENEMRNKERCACCSVGKVTNFLLLAVSSLNP